MGSLVSQQANGVQFLENGRAYEVLEVGRLELFKQPIARLAGKPQVLEDDADEYFRKAYLLPTLGSGLVKMTLPDKPRSSKQRYRLTALGRRWLETHPGA